MVDKNVDTKKYLSHQSDFAIVNPSNAFIGGILTYDNFGLWERYL